MIHLSISSTEPRMALLVAALTLAGCGGGSSGTPPTSFVPATPQGAAQASVTGDTAGVGATFFNATGQGFVLLSTDGDAPVSVMHVANSTSGRRAPASAGFVTLSYDRTAAQTLLPVASTTVVGTYQAIAGGQLAQFSVATDGTISAGSSACKLTGKIDLAAGFGGAQGMTLTVSGCGTVSNGTFNGVALASADMAPASLQFVAENGASVLDVLAYR